MAIKEKSILKEKSLNNFQNAVYNLFKGI